MELDLPTPRFTVGQEIANFLVSCGLLPKVWEDIHRANNTRSFTLSEYEDVAYVTFPSFERIEDFIGVSGSQCGEGNDDGEPHPKFFSGFLKGNDGEPVFIYSGALKLFLHIMEKTDFEEKLKIYTDSKQRKLKPIIFVGHSIGGAVATLATLWVLGKRLRQNSPFCITFGCPLVGDERLVEAVGRENWGGNFCHVVSKHDIVPRMLLAPIESIAEPFTNIIPYWQGINVPDSLIQDACRNLLNHVPVSPQGPYRPFGTYMLCSSNGAACVDNAKTVLELLPLTTQSQQTSFEEIVQACLLEHTRYVPVLADVMQNSVREISIMNSESSECSYEMGIALQLEAIGVGFQNKTARDALQGAGDTEKQFDENVDKLVIELSQKQRAMAQLEWYKERCEKDGSIGYYDTFKNQDMKDIHADRYRINLAGFWDEIIEKWEGRELPSDFQSQNKWINAGNTYRRLVEPLDIAFHYRTNRNGNYLSDGRPNRYKVLQKWLEEKDKTRSSKVPKRRTKRASLTQESCFWAYVEEAQKDLESLKQGQLQKLQNLEKFEEDVTKMEKDLTISSDVYFPESSFMMWWKEWKEYKKNQSPDWNSPLCEIIISKKMEELNLRGSD